MATAIAPQPSSTLAPATPATVPTAPSVPVQPISRSATYDTVDSLRLFSIADYDAMIQAGILGKSDKVELLEGKVVLKMARDPEHDGTIQILQDLLYSVIPKSWTIRTQLAFALSVGESQPEPDFAIVRGSGRDYRTRHPHPADVGLVIEVSNSSLKRDTSDKARIYSTNDAVEYWVVNLIDRRIEVYTKPSGGAYTSLKSYASGDDIPLTLDNVLIATLSVSDILL